MWSNRFTHGNIYLKDINTKINYNDEFKMVLVVRNDLKMGKG